MGARPTYAGEERDAICRRILDAVADGSSLRKACSAEGMPREGTIRLWLLDDEDFSAQYARAREARAEARSDRIDEICEMLEKQVIDANSARVMIDAEKWQAGKENPKRYGDRIAVDGEVHVRMSDGRLESRIAQLLGKAGAAGAIAGAGAPDDEA